MKKMNVKKEAKQVLVNIDLILHDIKEVGFHEQLADRLKKEIYKLNLLGRIDALNMAKDNNLDEQIEKYYNKFKESQEKYSV